MSKNIDQEYIKELARSLYFELSDEQLQKIVAEIQELDEQLQRANFSELTSKFTPVCYTRVSNCAKLRRDDEPDKKYDKDYLSDAKKADKYVVGK
ncbi:MAG: hypothetical protein MJ201_04300 [Mycoplasmoidaceae bacterium]|nr:hypothetical protein [Mycoplasmoidaceae bacterium]